MQSAEAAVLTAVLDDDEDEAVRLLASFTKAELRDLRHACTRLDMLIETAESKRYNAETAHLTIDQRVQRIFED
jgi:hypothetical protein